MEKMNWFEARRYMREFNKKHNVTTKGLNSSKCIMVAVISEDSFNQAYTLEERSYMFSNDNKAFLPGMGGYSIYADSLDGSDRGVRFELYVKQENLGGEWNVEYCYIKSEDC